MSALRGARVLGSLGQHAMRCNRLHQRRIVSLGLTSLCQVTTKHRALLDTTVVPVNKYDLNNGSLTAAVSQLLGDTCLEVSDTDDEVVQGPESELGVLVKWFTCKEMMGQVLQPM